MTTDLTLILGGVSSGKSVYAEGLAEAAGLKRLYVATAQASDVEMSAKIAAHQLRRGARWETVETPFQLANAVTEAEADIVLVDCVSMWLTNHLLAENDIEVEVEKLIKGLVACQSPMILVSNEVGLGGIEVNSLARRFATHQGRLNQRLAELAGTVHLVTSGLPIALKGSL